jgi:hypothetical protein
MARGPSDRLVDGVQGLAHLPGQVLHPQPVALDAHHGEGFTGAHDLGASHAPAQVVEAHVKDARPPREVRLGRERGAVPLRPRQRSSVAVRTARW